MSNRIKTTLLIVYFCFGSNGIWGRKGDLHGVFTTFIDWAINNFWAFLTGFVLGPIILASLVMILKYVPEHILKKINNMRLIVSIRNSNLLKIALVSLALCFLDPNGKILSMFARLFYWICDDFLIYFILGAVPLGIWNVVKYIKKRMQRSNWTD